MKVVDWAELSKLPSETIFQSIGPCQIGELQILGDVWDAAHLVAARLLPVSSFSHVLGLTGAEEARPQGR